MKNRSLSVAALPTRPELSRASLLVVLAVLGCFLCLAIDSSAAAAPNLFISEVHPNADSSASDITAFEWVELQNAGATAINLGKWTIEDAEAMARLPAIDLSPGAVALIVGGGADPIVPGGQTLIFLESARIGNGLRNNGDRVALVDPRGVRRDAVSWGDISDPQHFGEPAPGQSITRTLHGNQTLQERASPWQVDIEDFNQSSDRHAHPRPDTAVRISAALIDPELESHESVELANVTDERLVTVNWRLTIGGSQITLPSVAIQPNASVSISGPRVKFGSGLSKSGGHLVVRDPEGRWLATASWGDDTSFHQLPRPEPGAETWFSDQRRVHPAIPWYERFNHQRSLNVTDVSQVPLRATNIGNTFTRATDSVGKQESISDDSVWISEVYPTAGQGRLDPAYEWFELTNDRLEPVNLNGWRIADNRAEDSLDGASIPALASVAIGTSSDAGPRIAPIISDGRIGNGLANAGDQLRLINPDGEVVSAISWGSDRTFSVIRSPTNTQSIQRSTPDSAPLNESPSPGEPFLLPSVPDPGTSEQPADVQTEQPSSSQPSTPDPAEATQQSQPSAASTTAKPPQSPTPDSDKNESEPQSPASAPTAAATTTTTATATATATHTVSGSRGLLRITELLPAPLPNEAEWIEIENLSDQTISLDGWSLADRSGATDLRGSIAPGSRLVIATQPLSDQPAALIVNRIGNGLNNDGDTIALLDPSGTIVDEITYGNDALVAPARNHSIAREPARWVVSRVPSPGGADVTPLLANALAPEASSAPSPASTVSAPTQNNERLPIVQASSDTGVNAWMIVSFALLGVIAVLLFRRWRPDISLDQPPAVSYSGPHASTSPLDEMESQRD